MKNPYEYIKIFPDVIPKEHLEILNAHGLGNKDDTSPALMGYGPPEDQSTDLNYRNTHWIPLEEDLRFSIESGIRSLNLQSLYKREIVQFEPVQMLYYPLNGKYDEHNDSEVIIDGELKRKVDRDISIICYINDDYEGGELEFTFLGLKLKPKKGTIVAFPSYFEFTHRVHPVTKGERYSLVTWIETDERIYTREDV